MTTYNDQEPKSNSCNATPRTGSMTAAQFTDDDLSTHAAASTKKSKVNLLSKAIACLSRREHSAQELRQKLLQYTDDPQEVDAVLNRLQKENWQSDERFAQALTQSKISKWGSRRILHALQPHKLGEDAMQKIAEELKDTELARATDLWRKKFADKFAGKAHLTPQEYAKQARFLLARGFSPEIVRKVLKNSPYDDEV